MMSFVAGQASWVIDGQYFLVAVSDYDNFGAFLQALFGAFGGAGVLGDLADGRALE